MEQPNKQEAAEKLMALAKHYYQTIDETLDKGHLTNWFRAYMKSQEFETLDAQWKVDAFDALHGLEKYLNSVFEIIDTLP